MSNSTNVATVVDHAGTLYAYTARQSSITRLTRTVSGSKSAKSLNLDNSNVSSEAGIGVALSPPSTKSPAGQRVLFWVTDDNALVTGIDAAGATVRTVGMTANKSYCSIGVASLAAGAVTAHFNGSTVVVAVWGWSGLLGGSPKASVTRQWSASKLGAGNASAFSGDDGYNGSSAALATFIDASGATRLFLVTTWKESDGKVHVLGNVVDVDTDMDGDTVTATDLDVSGAVLDRVAKSVANCPSVLQRPDGRLMVWYADGNGIQQALVTPTTGSDWYGDWSYGTGQGGVPALGHYAYPCALAFVPGSVSTSTSPVANALIDATVDVFDGVFAQSDDAIQTWVDDDKWGTIRRTAQAPQPQQQILALGLIYGPPPVPLQNINMPAEYSNAGTSGIVSFSQSTGSTQGMSAQLGASLFGKIGGSAGYEEEVSVFGYTIESFSAKVQVELTLGASLMGTWSEDTTQSVTTTVQATVSLAGHAGSSPSDPNAYTVQQNGQIVGLASSWASYVYDFVDKNGDAPTNGLSFVAVFPYQPSLVVTPFVIPSGAEGPHPGDLTTYQLTQTQLNELDARAHAVGGRPYLQVSWSAGGLTAQQAETYDQSSWGVNLGLDLEVLLGGEVSGNLLGVNGTINGSATLKANFGYTWSGGGSTTAQFSSSVEVPGNPSARGTYSAYGYRAYLLAESAENLRALPAGSTGASSLTVSSDSKPWLITYAVTSSTLV